MPITVHLDARNVKCPIPVIRTRRALRSLRAGDVLEVTCTDQMAAIDVPCLLFETGDELLEVATSANIVLVRIRKV
jgi:tRNA 2-thiouridine synthesizing protein A